MIHKKIWLLLKFFYSGKIEGLILILGVLSFSIVVHMGKIGDWKPIDKT